MRKFQSHFTEAGLFLVKRNTDKDWSPFVFRGEEVDNILRASKPTEFFVAVNTGNPERRHYLMGRAF